MVTVGETLEDETSDDDGGLCAGLLGALMLGAVGLVLQHRGRLR
jgi:hypothetical protein